RAMFTKSVVAARALAVGQVITSDDLAIRKPGTGIAASRVVELIGRRVRRPLAAWQPITDADLLAERIESGPASQSASHPDAYSPFPMPAAGPTRSAFATSAAPGISVSASTEPIMRARP